MSNFTSSGRKLYNILKKAWDQSGTENTINVWAKVFAVDNLTHQEVSSKLIQLLALTEDVINDIKVLELSNYEKYLRPVEKIQLLCLNNILLDNTWQNIKGQISEESLELIDACGDLLIANFKDVIEVSPNDLEELQKEIKNLQDEIINSDIDKATKVFLINELRKIEEIIINYRIRGSSGLEKVTKEVSGGIIIKLFKNLIPKEAQVITQKVLEKAIKINSLITLTERLSKLPEGIKDVMKFLPPGNDLHN